MTIKNAAHKWSLMSFVWINRWKKTRPWAIGTQGLIHTGTMIRSLCKMTKKDGNRVLIKFNRKINSKDRNRTYTDKKHKCRWRAFLSKKLWKRTKTTRGPCRITKNSLKSAGKHQSKDNEGFPPKVTSQWIMSLTGPSSKCF